MTTILSLSPELLVLCFEQLYEKSQPLYPLRCLGLVCRDFHRVTRQLLFRNINISFPPASAEADNGSAGLLTYLDENEDILSYVQNIIFLSDASKSVPSKHNHFMQRALERLLPMLPNLRYIRLVHLFA